MIYWQLFMSFLRIGLLSFGGGYAALPLIEEEIINSRGWMSTTDFVDVLTMSEMAPGSLSINSATFVGNHIAGIPGSFLAALGVTLPSALLVLLLAFVYYRFRNFSLLQGIIRGLRPAVTALIISAGIGIIPASLFRDNEIAASVKNLDFISVLLIMIAFWILRKTKLGPIQVMVITGVIGIVSFGIFPS